MATVEISQTELENRIAEKKIEIPWIQRDLIQQAHLLGQSHPRRNLCVKSRSEQKKREKG